MNNTKEKKKRVSNAKARHARLRKRRKKKTKKIENIDGTRITEKNVGQTDNGYASIVRNIINHVTSQTYWWR